MKKNFTLSLFLIGYVIVALFSTKSIVKTKSSSQFKQKHLTAFNNSAQFNYTCKDNSSCSFNGHCINSTHCICNELYTTVLNSTTQNFQCNYNQRSKQTAFLISLFLGPTGMEHLYIGNYSLAILKLIIPFCLIILGTIVFIFGKKKENLKAVILGKVFEFSATIIIIIWWVIDLVLIACNIYNDENNISLYYDL